MSFKRILILTTLLSSAALSPGQMQRDPPQSQFTTISASGSTKFWTNPYEPYGGEKSFCRMTKNGKVVWQKDLPFSFEEAHISDSGTISGLAHTSGGKYGQFTIVILDPNGRVAMKHHFSMWNTMIADGHLMPRSQGMIFDPDHNRVIARMFNTFDHKGNESWFDFRLAPAKFVRAITPGGDPQKSNARIENAELVLGTNLILVSWFHFDEKYGHSLTLMDRNYRKVWGMFLPADLYNGPTGDASQRLYDQFSGRGAILRTDQPRRFDIRLFKMNSQVGFEAQPIGNGWAIKEILRKHFVKPAKSVPKPVTIRSASLPIIKSFTVPQSADFGTAVGDVGQFHFWGKDKIVYVREAISPSINVIDLAGTAIRSIPVPKEAKAKDVQLFLTKTTGSKFVLASADNGTEGKSSKAWNIDVATGQISPMPKFKSAWITALAGYPDGHFVVITHDFRRSSSVTKVSLYSPYGDLVWAKSDEWTSNRLADISSPEGLEVDSKGRIIVLDNIAHTLQYFEKSGKFVRAIDLDKKWGRKLSYPTNVATLSDGRLWLYDFGASLTCNLLDSNGGILRSFKPKFSNGKIFDSHYGITPDANGEAWVSNGKSISKLDKSGVAMRTIGNQPRVAGLGKISSLHVNPDGRVYALDAVTNSVFAFDSRGKKLYGFAPKPKEFDDSDNYNGLSITASGDVFFSGTTNLRTIHLSPDGQRLEANKNHPSWSVSKKEFGVPFSAKSNWRWQGTTLLDDKDSPRAYIQRWPDLGWMNYQSFDASPDGRFMAYEGTYYPDHKFRQLRLAFYMANGVPESQARFPTGMTDTSGAAYDGTTCYFITKEGLLAMNKRAETLWIYRPPKWNSRNKWRVFPSLGGLALYDGLRSITWINPKKVILGSEQVTLEMSESAKRYATDSD